MLNNNLWAPWRIEYLKSLGKQEENKAEGTPWIKKCFLCEYWNNPDQDRENLVLWRTDRCLVLFNRFPYTGGHLLIAPRDHVPDLNAIDEGTMLEMMLLCRDVQIVLDRAIHPQGYNIGVNIGRCSGAGLPDHVHLHLVPRWEGDTNFMSTIGNARVISQSIEELYDQLTEIAEQLKLPAKK